MNSSCPEQKSQKKRKSQSDEEHEGKAAPTTTADIGDEVEAFFSLVDRIQVVGKLLKTKRFDFSSATDISTSASVDSRAMQRKSAWKPSLEWEDFSYLKGKESDVIRTDKSDKIRTDKSNQLKSFDLNVEASSE